THSWLRVARQLSLAGLGALALTVLAASTGSADEPRHSLQTPVTGAAKAERWWRIDLYELDHGRWRSAGAFENPDRGRCIRYGEGWMAGRRRYRTYSMPFSFIRRG